MSCLNELSSYAVSYAVHMMTMACLPGRCVLWYVLCMFKFLFLIFILLSFPICITTLLLLFLFSCSFSMSFCFPFSYFNQQSFHMSLLFLFLLFSLSPYILKEIKFNYATMKKYPSFNKQQRQQQQQQCEQRAKTLACTCYLNMMMSLTALLPQAKLGTSKNKTKKNYPSLVDLHTNVFT